MGERIGAPMFVGEPHAQAWGELAKRTNAFCRRRQEITSVVLLSRSIDDIGITGKVRRAAEAPRLRVGFAVEQVEPVGNNRPDAK